MPRRLQKQLAIAFAIASAVFVVMSGLIESQLGRRAAEAAPAAAAAAAPASASLPAAEDAQGQPGPESAIDGACVEAPSLGCIAVGGSAAAGPGAPIEHSLAAGVEHVSSGASPEDGLSFAARGGGARGAAGSRVSIAGIVVDGARNPLAGACVYVRELDAERAQAPAMCATTDAAGSYRAPLAKSGADWSVTVVHPGHAIATKTVVDLAAPAEDVDFELRPAMRLDGSVVSAVDGAPIPSASIRVEAAQGGRADRASPTGETVADATGAFAFDGLAAGRYELIASAPGFETSRTPLRVERRESDPLRIVLEAAQARGGRVVDQAGNAVDGADIYVRLGRGEFQIVTVSAADGTFTIGELGKESVTVQVHKPGYATWTSTDLGWSAERWEVVLTAGLEVRGRVIDAETGAPIANAAIHAAPGANVPARVEGGRSAAGDDGTFILPGLARGEWTITVSSPSYLARDWKLMLESSNERNFALDPGGVIRGRVVGPDGEGLAGVAVQLGSSDAGSAPDVHRVESDHAGYFIARGLATGQYRVVMTHRDYVRLVGEAVPGELARDWRLSRGAGLGGKVRDARGRPGAGRVAVEKLDDAFAADVAVGADGRYAFTALPAGSYRVTLRTAAGAVAIELGAVELYPGSIMRRDYRLAE